MTERDLTRLLGASRTGELGALARRVAGRPYLSRADFLPDLSQEEGERLRGLAERAAGAGPAPILVFGVMPRSGTNFVRDLISHHPDVYPDPGRLWEFPLLHAARDARAFMDRFIAMFPRNGDVVGRWDALALLSGAWLRELQREAGAKRILLKSPHVQNLTLAPAIFPGAKIVLCLRDGRDVTASSMKTFSRWSPARKTFEQLAREWALSAEAILSFAPGGVNAHPDITVVRYEEMVADTRGDLETLFEAVGLDPALYPFEKLETMPVRGSSESARADDSRWQGEAKTADFKPVGRWSEWSAGQRRRFDRVAGATLRAAGYDAS
jgi:protein-tyrosine sulfotransferase